MYYIVACQGSEVPSESPQTGAMMHTLECETTANKWQTSGHPWSTWG